MLTESTPSLVKVRLRARAKSLGYQDNTKDTLDYLQPSYFNKQITSSLVRVPFNNQFSDPSLDESAKFLVDATPLSQDGPSGLQDEEILANAAENNYEVLGRLLTTKLKHGLMTALNKVYPIDHKEAFSKAPLTSKSAIIKALRSRSLVPDPVNALLNSGSIGLLEEVLQSGLIIPTRDEVKGFLQRKQTRLVLLSLPIIKVCKQSTHPLLKLYDIISEVINLFSDQTTLIEAIQIFKYIRRQDIEVQHLKQLKYLLLKLSSPQTENDCVCSRSRSPLMNCIIMSNFLDEIKGYNSRFTAFFNESSGVFVRMSEIAIKEVDDISHLRAIFADKPFGKDTLLDILYWEASKFRYLLNVPLMKQLVKEIWTGGLELEAGLDDCSYVVACFVRLKNPFDTHKKTLAPNTHSYFQLRSWLYHSGIRHVFESAASVSMTAYLMYIVISYIELQQAAMKPLNLTEEDTAKLYEDFSMIFDTGDIVLMIYIVLSVWQGACVTVYKALTKPTFKWDPRMFCELTILGAVVQFRPRVYGPYVKGDGDATPYEYIWTLMALAFMFKLFLLFCVNDKLGPTIRMLNSTFYDILRYLGIFALILLIFSITGNLLFYESQGYHTLTDTILTMIQAALGTVDFYAFESRELTGVMFMVLWIVIAAILIMNVLIAVLSSRYAQLSPQADADYVSLMLNYIDGTVYSNKYGGLIIGTTPFNIFTLPFTLLYLFPVDKEKLTVLLSRVSYIPLFFAGLACFLVHNAVWSLMCYLWVGLRILQDDERSLCQKAKDMAVWGGFGGLYLTYLSCLSLPVFVRYMLKHDPPQLSKAFTAENMKQTLGILKAYAHDHPDEVYLTWESAKNQAKTGDLFAYADSDNPCKGGNKSKCNYFKKAGESELRHAVLFIMKKFMSPKLMKLNLADTIETLETMEFSWLETFSMFEAKLAGERLRSERKDKLLIVI